MKLIIHHKWFFPIIEGNAGFRAHFPALFEPVPDGASSSEESDVEDRRPEDKDDEREAGTSVEVQIGRKLREMGDRFQHEQLHLVRMTSDWFRFKCKCKRVNKVHRCLDRDCGFHRSGYCHDVRWHHCLLLLLCWICKRLKERMTSLFVRKPILIEICRRFMWAFPVSLVSPRKYKRVTWVLRTSFEGRLWSGVCERITWKNNNSNLIG